MFNMSRKLFNITKIIQNNKNNTTLILINKNVIYY